MCIPDDKIVSELTLSAVAIGRINVRYKQVTMPLSKHKPELYEEVTAENRRLEQVYPPKCVGLVSCSSSIWPQFLRAKRPGVSLT